MFASAGFVLSLAPADAQMPRQADVARIQNNINFFVPGPTNDSAEAQKSRDTARRSIYEMAAHECDLLREVFAKDCRLESVSVNIGLNRQFGQQQEGYTVNGSMSYQITPK
ncbi:MAG TPA: hypothetical protein VGM09_15035 [Bradyrhizobium sp.]